MEVNGMDCIFCKIANREIPSDIVYEDDYVAAFKDLDPQAPVHVLVVPKQHIASWNELTAQDGELLSHIVLAVQEVAKITGIYESGYRVVNNCGVDGGQTVGHLHFHLLGGREMLWPAG